jgi:hypothetical protein
MSRGVVSGRHPAHAVVLARPRDAKPDTWITTGTPRWKTYPCFCRLGTACETTGDFPCRCWGRIDYDRFDNLPPHCCAARAHRLSRKDTPC